MGLISFVRALLSNPEPPVAQSPALLVSSTATTYPLMGHPKLNNAAYWLRTNSNAPRLVIFSGAGLSHESGLSLFRGSDGLWDNHKVEEVCNGLVWRNFRERVNAFYEKRWQDNLKAQPHAGHHWCAEQEAKGAVLLSQNVDTLLERAGALHVGHLHGRLDHHRCFTCDFRWARRPGQTREDLISCPACSGEDTRVDVVFFQEAAPAYESAHRVLGGLRPQDVLVVVGTTSAVVNPLMFLTDTPQVWVVDPDPPQALLNYPGSRIWRSPASALGNTVGVAWAEHVASYEITF